MSSLKLSIIVPIYNGEKYVGECLDSLLDQNIQRDTYEIIVIDDGSTDNTRKILQQYGSMYDNIQWLSQPNSGASVARNNGLQRAQGEYVWFVDGDDCICKDAIPLIYNILQKEKCDILTFDFKNAQTTNYKKTVGVLSDYLTDGIVGSYTWSNIARRELLAHNNIWFNKDIIFGEDILFWYTAFIYSQSIVSIKKCLYYYRVHSNSVTASAITEDMRERRIADIIKKGIVFQSLINCTDIPVEKRKAIILRNNIDIEFALEMLPTTSFNYYKILCTLKENQLYPYKFMWQTLQKAKSAKGVKFKIARALKFLFPIELYYKLYYLLRHKKHSKKIEKNH